MELRRSKEILALKTTSGKYLAFHARNMELAEIDQEAYMSLSPTNILESGKWSDFLEVTSEASEELQSWNESLSEEVSDLHNSTDITSFSINVSQLCNLRCTYCAADGDGTYGSSVKMADLSKVQKQLAWLIKKLNPKKETEFIINFLGGEPLLYPDLIHSMYNYTELLVAGTKIKPVYCITTNGTLINKKSIAILTKMNANVTVSLDGPEEINDRVRPTTNPDKLSSTQKTLTGLELLQLHRKDLSNVSVNAVFGNHNNEVLKSYLYLRSLPINWDQYSLNFANNDKNPETTKIYLDEMQKVAQEAYEHGGLLELSKIAQFRSALLRLESKTRLQSYCGAGKNLLQTDTSGDLYGCNWFMGDKEEKVGHLTDIDSKKWSEYSQSLIELQNCNTCWNRYICAGGCMASHKAQTGHRHIKDELFCVRSRTISSLSIYYYFLTLTKEVQDEAC